MARRRRDDDWIWPVAQLVGLFVVLGFIYPTFRQMVGGIGLLCVVPLVVAVVIVLVLGTCNLLARRGTAQTFSFNVSAPSATVAASDATQAARPSTIDLVQQVRSIDWFQFEHLVLLCYVMKRKKPLASLESLMNPTISRNNSHLGKQRGFSCIASDLTQ